MHPVDAVDIEAHLPEQPVQAHRRVEFQFPVFHREFSARVKLQDKLGAVSLFATRHLHGVGAGHNSGALSGFKRSRSGGRNVGRF